MKLSDIPEFLGNELEKEIFDYTLNTEDNFLDQYLDYSIINPNIRQQMKEISIKIDAEVSDTHFDFHKYTKYYCERDVQVLYDGLMKCDEIMTETFEASIFDYLTISSYADNYMIRNKVYEGVYEIGGVCRDFIQKTIVGGCVRLKDNEKDIKKNCVMQDFDAVSLYPSAMYRCSLPTGRPYFLSKSDLNNLTNINKTNIDTKLTKPFYYVKIIVKQINTHKHFPLQSTINEGIREFTNNLINKSLYVDKIALEDFINYQDATVDITEGYFFEGSNNTIQSVIKKLFDLRLKFKNEGNDPAQNLVKLMLNSCYGKSSLRHSETSKKLIQEKCINNFIGKHYRSINKITKVKSICVVDIQNNKLSHFNRVHVGSTILSMSKRIMNEVITIVDKDIDTPCPIYYQDTDSLHIFEDDINILEQKYKQIYGRDLIGKNMGQFHSDFKSDIMDKKLKIYSRDFIMLGKKCYIDVLTNEKNQIDYHIRMKGIPT